MSCNFPIRKFSPPAPCGRCLGCRVDKAAQMVVRLMHELSLWKEACFITLTYSDENLPGHSLVKEDVQKFMKRLRWKLGKKISYYLVGEYSDNLRQHYHAIIFGHDFRDHEKYNQNGTPHYEKNLLGESWNYQGRVHVGDCNSATIQYVAKYVQKKLMGKENEICYETMAIEPEFSLSSRKPAIGFRYFKKMLERRDYNDGELSLKIAGRKRAWPKYYKRKLAETVVKRPVVSDTTDWSKRKEEKAQWMVSQAARQDFKKRRSAAVSKAQADGLLKLEKECLVSGKSREVHRAIKGQQREQIMEQRYKLRGGVKHGLKRD